MIEERDAVETLLCMGKLYLNGQVSYGGERVREKGERA
jgi:hypothetical protein